jgi:predicted amidohydrolase YtcJ
VLDRNLFEIAPTDIADTKVTTTFFEGRAVYES